MRDQPVVGAFVDDAHQQKQGAGRHPVADHLEDGALQALRVENERPEHHEAHVADARVRDQLLEVRLDHADQGAIQDGDDRQADDDRGVALRRIGQQRNGKAQEAVPAQLEEDAGQDDRPGGGGLDVGIRQPGVERPHRHLDGERQEECDEGQSLQVGGEAEASQRLVAEGEVPGGAAVRDRHGQDGDEHQQGADQGVDHELDRGVDAACATPDPDDQVHRDQADLPEDVEEEQVERHEDAEHPDHQQQHGRVVLLDPRLDGGPGVEDRHHRQHRGQDHQHHGEPIDAHRVAHAEGGDPGVVLAELELGTADLVAKEQAAEPEAEQGRPERHPANSAVVGARDQQKGEHPCEGREHHQRKDREVHQ